MQPAQKAPATAGSEAKLAAPPVVVYKTKRDYSDKVPVILSEDKSSIVSYPAITDLNLDGELLKPKALQSGYLLDRKGINARVAFLDYTYEEYAALSKTPSRKELMTHIVDADPLLEIWSCGTRQDFTDIEAELNQMIASGKLPANCKNLR